MQLDKIENIRDLVLLHVDVFEVGLRRHLSDVKVNSFVLRAIRVPTGVQRLVEAERIRRTLENRLVQILVLLVRVVAKARHPRRATSH